MGCWLVELEPVRSIRAAVEVRLRLFSRAVDAWELLDGASDDIVDNTRLFKGKRNVT